MKNQLQNVVAVLVGLAVMLSSCAPIPKKNRDVVADAARQEMHRRGWRRIEVYRCIQRDGVWVVTLGTKGARRAVDLAWVTVTTNGSIVGVVVNDR